MLVRIILVIPHAVVLFVLAIVSLVLAAIAAIMILVQEKYSTGIFDFIRADLRWNARVFAYLAGFSQDYPPFVFDTGPEGGEPVAAGVTMPMPPSGTNTGATP